MVARNDVPVPSPDFSIPAGIPKLYFGDSFTLRTRTTIEMYILGNAPCYEQILYA